MRGERPEFLKELLLWAETLDTVGCKRFSELSPGWLLVECAKLPPPLPPPVAERKLDWRWGPPSTGVETAFTPNSPLRWVALGLLDGGCRTGLLELDILF